MSESISIHNSSQSPAGFTLPDLSCDCHTHVFGPGARYPYWTGRGYTPPDASVAEMKTLHRHLGIGRVVIVHPSPYGTDNRVSLDAADAIGPSARVVAVIDAERIDDAELAALAARPVAGIRLNFKSTGVGDVEKARTMLRVAQMRVKPLGWHIQLFADVRMLMALADDIARSEVTIVADHFGLPDVARGVAAPEFQTLVKLVRDGALTVKLSAGYRVTRQADWSDLEPFAAALIGARAGGVVWGSDWPHPGDHVPGTPAERLVPFQQVDNGHALRCLRRWCANDDAIMQRILVDTPARLYRFG